MKIDIIYVACYRRDFRLARILIASIRHWHPDIPIALVKDEMLGKFDTTEVEKFWNVSVYPQKASKFGWGFSKLEIFFEEEKKRFLMLDSDIILAGPILNILEEFDEDFIVYDEPFTKEDLYRYYFDLEKLLKFDPEFKFPGFTFNTGQFVGTSGILKRSDFDDFIEWSEPRIMRYREIFTFGGEQPIVNYIFMKKMLEGKISLRRVRFMRDGLHADTNSIELKNIVEKKGYPFVVHWHDKKPRVFLPKMDFIPRNDLLLHFEEEYYRKSNVGKIAQYLRIQKERAKDKLIMTTGQLINNSGSLKKIRDIYKKMTANSR